MPIYEPGEWAKLAVTLTLSCVPYGAVQSPHPHMHSPFENIQLVYVNFIGKNSNPTFYHNTFYCIRYIGILYFSVYIRTYLWNQYQQTMNRLSSTPSPPIHTHTHTAAKEKENIYINYSQEKGPLCKTGTYFCQAHYIICWCQGPLRTLKCLVAKQKLEIVSALSVVLRHSYDTGCWNISFCSPFY